MKNEYKGLALNTFYLYIIQVFNYILPLFCLPYLLVTLDGNSFGIFSFAQAFVQFVILFVNFGFNITATKRIAETSDSLKDVQKIYLTVTIAMLLLFFGATLILIPWLYLLDNLIIYREAIFVSLISVIGIVLFPMWLFQGLNQLKAYSIINVIARFVTLPFLFVIVKNKDDYLAACFIYSIALFMGGIISIVYLFYNRLFSNIFSFKISYRDILKELKDSVAIFLSNSAISLYTNGLTLILGLFASANIVGLFSALDRVVRMICFGIFVPINQAAFPVLAKLRDQNFTQGKIMLKKILLATVALMSFILISFYAGENYVIYYFFYSYPGVTNYLRIFIVTILAIATGGVLGQLGLIALGGEREKKAFSRVYMTVGFVFFPLSFFIIKCFLLKGAILSMMFSEFFVFISMAFYIKRFKIL